MPKRQSRLLEQQRQYQGERDAQPLINWLNLSPDKEGRDRVGTILSLYARLHNQREFGEDAREGTRSPEDVVRDLNQALQYFQMIPTINVIKADGNPGDWHAVTGWMPVPGSQLAKSSKKATAQLRKHARKSPELFFDDGETAIAGMFIGEDEVIRIALRLIETGLFWQVGPCTCGKIFFRRFRHQRFCSEKCRIADFRNSNEARTKRNEYARKLYHLHKTGKVK